MPTASIDRWIAVNQRFPEDLYAFSAASPLDASANSSTAFHGVFVDAPGGVETIEAWEVVHSARVDAQRMARFRQQQSSHSIIEMGAIAIASAVLEQRSSIRLGNVQKIGARTDYTLVDKNARPAGVIEFKGLSSRYTSDAASGARKQAQKSKTSPRRIGVVAFGRPEVRLEVVG
jgi:hypothetical protein